MQEARFWGDSREKEEITKVNSLGSGVEIVRIRIQIKGKEIMVVMFGERKKFKEKTDDGQKQRGRKENMMNSDIGKEKIEIQKRMKTEIQEKRKRGRKGVIGAQGNSGK